MELQITIRKPNIAKLLWCLSSDHCLYVSGADSTAPQRAQVVEVGQSQLLTREMEMVSMHAVRLYV